MLERAATGLAAATNASRVYCAVLTAEGALDFKAAAPVGSGAPGTLSPDDFPDLARALREGRVLAGVDLPAPFDGHAGACVVPWTGRGEVLGVGILVLEERAPEYCGAMLALIGSDVGETLLVLRSTGELAQRLARMNDVSELLDVVMEHSTDAMKLIDLDGHVLRWNTASERLYGWPEPEVLGQKLPHVPETRRLAALADIRSTAGSGRSVRRQAVQVRSDGSKFEADLTVVPFVDGDGHPAGVLGIVRPVSERVKEVDSGADLSTVLARTLKSSLTAVAGYAQLLARTEILDEPARRKRTVNALEQRAHEMTELIDALILIDRLETGTTSPELEEIDPAGLVADVVAHYEQNSTPGRVLIDYEAGLPRLHADRRLIARGLAALLDSAAQAANEACVEVSVLTGEESVIIEVKSPSDSGAILDEARASAAAKPLRAGGEPLAPGLDLHLARRIIEAHGGRVEAVSSAGGVTFRVHLPVEVDR